MKIRFFQRLAWEGMKKNGKFYVPYLLTCICMVMMFYILQSLSYCPLLHQMKGGGMIEISLSLGKIVIAVFALIFLLYTNTFLLRRRNREFGLYYVLGMGKRGIRRIVFWETLIAALIGLAGGLALGIAFSKLAELCLANILKVQADYTFTLSGEAVIFTVEVYGVISLILMLRCMASVQRTNPLELLRSDRMGERPPKANWLMALLGLLLLGTAYFLAVSIQNPLTAMVVFFVAVIMVILATYLLFMAGSVALCRLLQKNTRYYYKKQHFVSVSSMAFRMKRNGAGLASICILSTMVLVMISSTSSLYFGMEDTLKRTYPRDVSIAIFAEDISVLNRENLDSLRSEYENIAAAHGLLAENVLDYCYAEISAVLSEDGVNLNPGTVNATNFISVMDDLRVLVFMGREDFNRIMGTELLPEKGEAYAIPNRCSFARDSVSVGELSLKVLGTLSEEFPVNQYVSSQMAPYIIFVVKDLEEIRPLDSLKHKDYKMLSIKWDYECDYPNAEDEEIIQVFKEQRAVLAYFSFFHKENGGYSVSSACRALERLDFIGVYGGLFFLGIILSLVFVLAAVLIIYYKQISEGYEDQARFGIMRKVGMTKRDIRQSVNSQVLTVFFAPLIFAGIHLAFAYPLIWKLLQLFSMKNLLFVLLVTVTAYVVFGVFYMIVYRLTARTYYNIVSN